MIIWAWKWLYFPLLWCHVILGALLWHHCDLDTISSAPQHSRNPQKGAAKIWKWSDWWFQRYTHFCTPPVILIWQCSVSINYVSTNLINVYTCPLSSPWQCATPHIWLECGWPDVRVLLVQVPAWYLILALPDQGWWTPGLSALHSGHGRLCSYEPLGPIWWRSQMRSREIPQLHWKHLWWWDLPQVHVYELEEVKKRPDKSVNELIDRIWQLAHHAQIGNGSDAAIELEVQCRLIQAIPDTNIKLQKELLKVNYDKKVSDLLEISHMYYAIESGVAAMCTGKAIHTLCQGHQPQKNKPQKFTPQCPNCTLSHSPGHYHCPAWNAICKGCSRKGHWHVKCCSSSTVGQQPTKSNGAEKAPYHWCCGKGKRVDIVLVSTEEHPHVMSCSLMQSIVEP